MADPGAETSDILIIGAGSAGCVLAARLSEDPRRRVTLVEAGGSDHSWKVRIPSAMAYPLADARMVWRFASEPEAQLEHRMIHHPRGRMLGGTSSINGMMFVRGHPVDFNRWAEEEGCAGWSWPEVLPYFRRMERWEGGSNAWRGESGPLTIRRGRGGGRLNAAFLSAIEQAGYGRTEDINGFRQEGAGAMAQTIRGGVRESTARAYLDPVRGRANLRILTGLTATGLIFAGRRCQGASFRRTSGETVTLHATDRVVLAAGPFGSAQLLLLAGIGPAEALQAQGISPLVDRPGVGANLQDHPDLCLRYECLQPVTLHPTTRPLGKLLAGIRWFATRTGPAASNHFEVGGFIRSGPGQPQPDLQVSFLPLALAPGAVQSDTSIGRHGFQVMVDLIRPLSRGTLWLRNRDPLAPPAFSINYLAHEQDRSRALTAIRLIREILAQPAMLPFRGRELTPGDDLVSDEDLLGWIAANADSAYHPVGTCRMGRATDPMSVVDPQGRVLGVERLTVCDSAIMPSLVGGNTNAATIMLAEKLSDHIANRQPLPAEPAPFWTAPDWQTRQREGTPKVQVQQPANPAAAS